ncbi:MAG: TVP38/TMEM64 family protein [Clostridia bacterium]|nr:TVP38/TMEM64 family protein [Clostridia bacterium]
MGKARERTKKLFKDKELGETKHYSKKVSAIVLSTFSVLSCILAIWGFIWLKTNFSDTDAFKAFVEKNYFLSAIALILICALQVIIALIPGELIEIAAGYAFGAIPGALICLTGITLGSVCVLLLARKFGRGFVESLYPREKIDSLPILRDPKKRNIFTILLFLIPGTPKDLVTYIIGITEMSIPLYLIIATFARIPSIIMSTIGGDALGDNKFVYALVAFIISGVVSLIGYLVYLRISKKHKKKVEISSTGNINN